MLLDKTLAWKHDRELILPNTHRDVTCSSYEIWALGF